MPYLVNHFQYNSKKWDTQHTDFQNNSNRNLTQHDNLKMASMLEITIKPIMLSIST
jgi:hypothetical protein